MKEQHIGHGNHSTFITSKTYTLKNILSVKDGNDFIDINVKIEVDLNDVEEKYHEIFVNLLNSHYLGIVSFGDNPFSKCEPSTKRYWWQFWK